MENILNAMSENTIALILNAKLMHIGRKLREKSYS